MSQTKTQNHEAIEAGMRQATTNREYVDRFDQLNGTQIGKLFWIAASLENFSDLEEFLQEMEDGVWNEILPECGPSENEHFEEYRDDNQLIQLLIDHDKYGFIAEILTPECSNFRYDEDGKLTGWSTHHGSRTINYVYAETIEGLYAAIEKVSEVEFEYFKNLDSRKKQANNHPQI